MNAYMCVYICVCMCVCICVYVCVYICVCMYVLVCVYMCMYVYYPLLGGPRGGHTTHSIHWTVAHVPDGRGPVHGIGSSELQAAE